MYSTRQKIGLFGGTFDPVHLGHIHIARAFADELALSSVVFLPAGQPYHKDTLRTAAVHRLAMVRLAVQCDGRFAVSDVDMIRSGPTYTFDTIQIFRRRFPHAELWWLMGMDSFLQLHTWHNWRLLVQQIHIAVAARAGQPLSAVPLPMQEWMMHALDNGSLYFLQAARHDISSSEIRGCLHSGQAVDQWLDVSVGRYIRKNRLYCASDAANRV